jgi:hypothetical protein
MSQAIKDVAYATVDATEKTLHRVHDAMHQYFTASVENDDVRPSLEQAADAIADTIGVLHHAATELDRLRSTDRSTHPGDSCVEAVVGAIRKASTGA